MSGQAEKLAAGADVNPLKSDFELQTLLKKLDKVKKYKTFQRWKAKFLDRLEQFLYEKGMDPAEKACNQFAVLLTKFVKTAGGVADFIEKGDLGNGTKTVKASLALNEMCNSLTKVVSEVQTLIPSRKQEEKKKGFSKFHLGAALIRQGFHQYATMKAIEDAVTEIGVKLEGVADRQQQELFAYYQTVLQRFCDVMADLNLYEVMLKCIEFADPPEEEESSDEEDITIEIEVDTPEGKKLLKLEVDPNEKIGNIKSIIADSCGIEPTKQVVKFKGNELTNDNATLKALGIDNRAKLTVEPFRIPISVKTYDGKTIDMMVDPSIYMSDIKRNIAEESGIPAPKQKLFMDGKELDNDFLKAEDYGIKAGSQLYMEPKSISVTTTMPDGTAHTFDVTMSDTPEAIKAMIANETGMPTPTQVLNLNGKELLDGKTLRDLGVQDGANIDVSVLKIPVIVETYDGERVEVDVDPTSYLSDLKRQLETETGVPAVHQKIFMKDQELPDDNMKAIDYGIEAGSLLYMEPKSMSINVELPEGKVVSVDVAPSDTIDIVKNKIADCSGIISKRQVLKHGGIELANKSTVKQAGLKDGSTVKVEIFTVPVTVNTHDGKKIEVMADPTARLIDFKKQLQDESGLEPSNQQISLLGDVLDNDSKTLNDYGVSPGSELDLEPKSLNIEVEMPDSTVVSVGVSPSDTARDIKDKIAEATGMLSKRQVLKHDDKELMDKTTAKQAGLKDGSKLKVDVFTIPLTVNTYDGKKIEVMADPTATVIDFKKQLENESGLAPSNQQLSLNGNTLGNDRNTLGDYGVEPGSELDLEPKSMKIQVELPNSRVIEVEVSPSETIESVKDKIADSTGMLSKRQVMKHNGKEVANPSTVRNTGLKDGSHVKVEVFTIPITVNTHDGKKIKLQADPTARLSDFKTQLENDSGLPPANQKLSLHGEVLGNDNTTLEDYGIVPGSELDLEPMSIEIGVEMPDGKKHKVNISPLDTDEAIKAKIEQQTGMAAPRQVLKMNGKTLPSHRPAKDMGIEDGSTITVELFTIPVTVRSMDGRKAKVMVDPTASLGSLKRQLEGDFDIPASNQKLFLQGHELADNKKSSQDHGIKAGSELYLEPSVLNVSVQLPNGETCTVKIAPSDTSAEIKAKIAEKTSIAVPRQILGFNGTTIPEFRTARDLGVKEGSPINVSLFTIPVSVKTPDGQIHSFNVEPCASVDSFKKIIEKDTGIPIKKQLLKLDDEELKEGKRSVDSYGVKARSALELELITDHIVFVDVKCGTLFAMERDLVISKGALNPHQNNKLDFLEAAKDSASRDKLVEAMKASPKLGFATQVVVEKNEVEDYDLEEAEKVKNMWGVNLKKREKNKRGEELIFVDPKTGACGELSRKKYIDLNFITPAGSGKEETITEAEKDTMLYEKYIAEMRNVFGIKSAN